jgi:hypothetical protein
MYQVEPPLSASMPTSRRGTFLSGQMQIAVKMMSAVTKKPHSMKMMCQSKPVQDAGEP